MDLRHEAGFHRTLNLGEKTAAKDKGFETPLLAIAFRATPCFGKASKYPQRITPGARRVALTPFQSIFR